MLVAMHGNDHTVKSYELSLVRRAPGSTLLSPGRIEVFSGTHIGSSGEDGGGAAVGWGECIWKSPFVVYMHIITAATTAIKP